MAWLDLTNIILTYGYIGLFIISLAAATIIPLSSEALLLAMVVSDKYNILFLIIVATSGNSIGAIINWLIGGWCLGFQSHKYFPIKKKHLENAITQFNKWGKISLLFTWLPIIGDPITFAAGALRVPFIPFIILTIIGKLFRYIIFAFSGEYLIY